MKIIDQLETQNKINHNEKQCILKIKENKKLA